MKANGFTIPSAPEWEAYKMRRTNSAAPISDYAYLIWPRLLDGQPYREELKEIYVRLLETEPFWRAQPVANWDALTELFRFAGYLRDEDWEGAVITVDNVIKYTTEFSVVCPFPLNKGVMSKMKAVMKEDFIDVQFAGEVFPLYRR